jgi:uracil-DNA glycosylase
VDNHQALSEHTERDRRKAMLREPHIRPLTDHVESIRTATQRGIHIPYFDPLDGGAEAEALFLLEAPGPRAVSSGFISRDNPDVTARNMRLMSSAAGMDRTRTVLWNIVPWYLGTGTRIRAANVADVREAQPWLSELLSLLPRLRVVALVGRKALLARPVLQDLRPDLQLTEMPHPSPLFVNRAAGNRQQVQDGLRRVARAMNA